MAKNLVIVESPAKAKTIARYLGKEFEVKSSFGHIRDLPKKDMGIDIKKGFEPTYEVSEEKQKVADELKKSAKSAVVWLASDEDREGEAIAWHVSFVLGLDASKVKRIVFHEITEPAITAAVANPRKIDMKLVHAQQARRVLDRLVGYELSPVLWKKIRTGLSAGRVQSVAVRLIVEREREIKDFKTSTSVKVSAEFSARSHKLLAELTEKLPNIDSAHKLLKASAKSSFEVASVEQKPGVRTPAPPFTTSTLQQEAARRLGFSVKQTMVLAQKLYEHGRITYMRTDSTNMSQLAIDATEKYILSEYGKDYSRPTQYQTKTRGAQEAHEAIRPTHIKKTELSTEPGQNKLYQLIWRRAVASQMSPAKVQRTEAIISAKGLANKFIASGEVLTFDGFFKAYGRAKDDKVLPPIEKGQKLDLELMVASEAYNRPSARYSEASLVKKLEELGIGRPSTYAPTINTIQAREYVEKKDLEGEPCPVKQLELKKGKITESTLEVVVGADRQKLIPTQLAEIVTDFLVKHFAQIVDYDFTAKAEEEFDDIAEGKLTWQQMIEQFYKHFHPLVTKSDKVSRAEVSQARKLGVDPSSKKPVYARYGRYGPVLQIGEVDPKADSKKPEAESKPRFAPLPSGVTLEDVTLKEALPMFALPRVVGQTADGKEITANVGRFGPYVKIDELYVSIKDIDPLRITQDEARKLIHKKQKANKERIIAEFDSLKVLNGPFGPYVTDGKTNVKIPKSINPKKITQKKAEEILKNPPVKAGNRFRKSKR